MKIDRILERVPDYRDFSTVDELAAATRRLAQGHPGRVRLVSIGRSTDGEEISMVRIGRGPEQLLFFACPHPNEPIGAMTLDALASQLVSDPTLCGDRHTWNLIPCIDPDGTRLNEGWFKGPFTITQYAAHFYRPASVDQAESTFPVAYKDYEFWRPIPETQALMTAITGLRPRLVYSLHNAGVGGGYYYVWPHAPQIDDALRRLMVDRGVPLSLGEPEVPWAVPFSPAVYRSTTLADVYDFHEAHGRDDPGREMRGGETSCGFARSVSCAAHLICELPYFHDERIADSTTLSISRREAVLRGLDASRDMIEFLVELAHCLEGRLTLSGRLPTAARLQAEETVAWTRAKRLWAEESAAAGEPATVAHAFDSRSVVRFYLLLIVGMARRALAAERAFSPCRLIDSAYDEISERFDRWATELEDEIRYRVFPIKTLVEIQLGAALHVLDTLSARGSPG